MRDREDESIVDWGMRRGEKTLASRVARGLVTGIIKRGAAAAGGAALFSALGPAGTAAGILAGLIAGEMADPTLLGDATHEGAERREQRRAREQERQERARRWREMTEEEKREEHRLLQERILEFNRRTGGPQGTDRLNHR